MRSSVDKRSWKCFTLKMTNGLSRPYHLDEPNFILRGVKSDFSFLMKFFLVYRKAPDGTHKKNARLIMMS